MQIGNFECGMVVVLHPESERTVTVENVVDVVECLTLRWPTTTGPYYDAAQRCCLAVLNGKLSEQDALTAFLLAAEEANVVVLRH
jgi:hypothetical protein